MTGTGKNGFQATGEALQSTQDPVAIIAGAAMVAASPAGTIDFNVNFKITGNGQTELTGGQTKGFPSYAAYSYTVGENGNIQTQPLFGRPENQIEDLTKPMTPIPE